ncbi:hypothetical protein ACOSP7_005341 [Xanthoceras sorbifolium]
MLIYCTASSARRSQHLELRFLWTHSVSQGHTCRCPKLMRVAIWALVPIEAFLRSVNIVCIGHTSSSWVCFRICNPKRVYALRILEVARHSRDEAVELSLNHPEQIKR